MAKKKAVTEMSAMAKSTAELTKATFVKMQKKIDKPKCYGNHGSVEDQCWQCWYHPDCKLKPKKKE